VPQPVAWKGGMTQKTPALLVVLVDSGNLRWFVAAIDLDGQATPLLRSVDGDLARYLELGYDDQVSFLRHRLCGVVQRGCDRLWGRELKACHFVFVFEGSLPGENGGLVLAVAEHFTMWMLNPPVVVYGIGNVAQMDKLAGNLDEQSENLVRSRLSELRTMQENPEAWELSQKKSNWQPEP